MTIEAELVRAHQMIEKLVGGLWAAFDERAMRKHGPEVIRDVQERAMKAGEAWLAERRRPDVAMHPIYWSALDPEDPTHQVATLVRSSTTSDHLWAEVRVVHEDDAEYASWIILGTVNGEAEPRSFAWGLNGMTRSDLLWAKQSAEDAWLYFTGVSNWEDQVKENGILPGNGDTSDDLPL